MLFDIKKGLKVLRDKIKNAPNDSGVYRMLGESGEVLYVGKAKDIKKRIASYTHIDQLPHRLKMMVSQIVDMEFIITQNESRALLLENELIKKLEPKYNILLKDDKTFPHLSIDMNEDYPRIRKDRGKRDSRVKNFGPFANVYAVNNVLSILQRAFLLRTCSDSYFSARTRPCMLHQIKRCSAPCVDKISKEEYKKLTQDAVDFLEGKNSHIQEDLSIKMQKASSEMNYETALVLRDRIKALTTIQQGQNLEYANIKSTDFVAITRSFDMVCIQVFFIRSGQNCGNVAYFPKQVKDTSNEEVLEAFLSSFYTNHIPPKEVVISINLESIDFLEKAIGTKILFSQRGDKLKISDMVLHNAVEALSRKIAEITSSKNNLDELVRVFELDKIPQRIEVYDNSHIQGSYAIGSFIVATPEGFDRKQYRTFNIKNQAITNDDFAMMKEVLSRRFDKMNVENKPDIIIIDGGLGQLSSVYEALKEYDLSDIFIIAMSKGVDRNAGREQYHVKGRESFTLEYQSPLAFYLQNLRDEAHRFAIGTHRKKRAKSMSKSGLDDIIGIGATRKRDLLNHFGSISQIKEASIENLMKVIGISNKTAEKIYNHFHLL